ncbi:hypothetical protein [Peribacillus frigoritolerans]|uniref:hypothetical protein n=1 Tax=Peribacillus castrilensis TaxID=2897690 RepID=UPI002DCB04C1|nr:hypothetical protein [Peribacillus castrilensis]
MIHYITTIYYGIGLGAVQPALQAWFPYKRLGIKKAWHRNASFYYLGIVSVPSSLDNYYLFGIEVFIYLFIMAAVSVLISSLCYL